MEDDERKKWEQRLADAYAMVHEAHREHMRSLMQIYVAQHVAVVLFVAIFVITR